MTIQERILQVMRQVGGVTKTSSPNLPYRYASEEAILAALRPAMIEAGLHFCVERYSLLHDCTFTNQKGTVMVHVIVNLLGRLSDVEGNFILVSSQGEGMDAGDKAINKASTGALKYALRQTFLLETGDDPDATNSQEYARSGHLAQAAREMGAVPAQEARSAPEEGGPVSRVRRDAEGQYHVLCETHGWSKARHFGDKIKCTKITGNGVDGKKIWCSFGVPA